MTIKKEKDFGMRMEDRGTMKPGDLTGRLCYNLGVKW